MNHQPTEYVKMAPPSWDTLVDMAHDQLARNSTKFAHELLTMMADHIDKIGEQLASGKDFKVSCAEHSNDEWEIDCVNCLQYVVRKVY